MRSSWPLAALLGGVFVLLSPTPAGAKDETGDAQAFGKAIEGLHKDCKKEKFESGLRHLQSLLERHENQDYVRARRVEIVDLAERFSFGATYEAPKASDVLSGRVQKFDPGTGYLKIQYEEPSSEDLQRARGGLLVFPTRTRGSFLLEVWGRQYPSSTSRAPQVLISGDEHPRTKRPQAWTLVFGTPPQVTGTRETWLPASITHFDGETREKADSQDVVSIPVGKPYVLRVKVSDTRITMGVNGKTLCTARKPKDVWGFVGFEAPDWTKLCFSGTIEPAWIQDRLDKAVLEQRKAFEETWDPKKVLPAWLFEGTTAATPAPERPDLPVEIARKLRPVVRRFDSMLAKGDLAGALAQLAALEEAGAPDAVCAFLNAQLNLQLGLLGRALAEIDRSLKVAPEFLEGLLIRGHVLSRLGRVEDALKTFQDAMRRHEMDPLAYETAAVAMLLLGRTDAAKRATELAAQKGVHSKQLEVLGQAVVRAVRGPTWNEIHEYKSRNYHVISDIDKKTCQQASKLLEEALTSYRVNFHWVTHDKSKLYKVYLFSGQRGFMNYMAELQGLMGKPTDRAAGVYSPLLKQLLIWNLPDRDAMMETVRHEGFHQYLDRFMPDAPIWFNEGMAVYHENGVTVRGRLEFGQVHPRYVELLKEKGLIPLEEFLHFSAAPFYGQGARSYAQAWALVHMLREGDSTHRALFEKLVEDMQKESAYEVIARHFPPEEAKKLERDLKAYVGGL